MRTTIPKTLILLAAATLCWGAGAAHAGPMSVIRDCSEDGILNHKYSQRELSGALERLPSDIDEYTDCRGVIRRAQLAGPSRKSARPKGILQHVDRKTPPTIGEQANIDKASKTSPGPVSVGGSTVRPGASGGAPFQASSLGTSLPPFVLAALIAVGALALGGTGLAAQRRWPQPARVSGSDMGGPLRRLAKGIKRGISSLRR